MTLVQARVNERTAKRLSAYAKAKSARRKKFTDNDLVHHALQLVIVQANRQHAALQQKIRSDNARYNQILGGGTSSGQPKHTVKLGPQVPAGTAKTFQATIKDAALVERLRAMNAGYDANDSEIVRRGFMLIIEEMRRDRELLLQQIHDEYLDTIAAIEDDDDLASQEPDVSSDDNDATGSDANKLVDTGVPEPGADASREADPSALVFASGASAGP